MKRYTEKELAEFEENINQKISETQKQIQSLSNQRLNQVNVIDNSGSYGDGSKNEQILSKLAILLENSEHYLQKLKAALGRIENQTYGIDFETGEIIDKRRLLAEPTATTNINRE